MFGVLVIDKPLGPTSFDVVKKVRALLKVQKVGHTGTLDPLATGVLPVCVGEATKIAGFILETEKAYDAVVRLGVSTDSYDAQGKVTAAHPRVPGGGARSLPRELPPAAADVLGGEGRRQEALRARAQG